MNDWSGIGICSHELNAASEWLEIEAQVGPNAIDSIFDFRFSLETQEYVIFNFANFGEDFRFSIFDLSFRLETLYYNGNFLQP